MSSESRIARVSFSDGARWLLEGANLVGHGGVALVRVAAWLVVLSLLQAVPVIGLPLLIVLSPVLTGGLLGVFRRLEAGQAGFDASALFDGFRDGAIRARLLVLGGLLLTGLLAALLVLGAWLSPQMDLQALNELMADPERMEREPGALYALFEGVNLAGGLALAGLVLALVLAALYFAVPLVFFWRWPVVAAVLWSLRAALVNWLAFLGFGLLLFAVLMAAGFLFLMVGGLLSLALGTLGQLLIQIVSVLISLMVQLILAAAQWRAFRQVFPPSSGSAGESGGGPPGEPAGDAEASADGADDRGDESMRL